MTPNTLPLTLDGLALCCFLVALSVGTLAFGFGYWLGKYTGRTELEKELDKEEGSE